MMDTRARITIPDIVYSLVTVFFIGALWPVFYAGYEDNLSILSTGEEYLFRLILPMTVLVLLVVMWVKTIGGRP